MQGNSTRHFPTPFSHHLTRAESSIQKTCESCFSPIASQAIASQHRMKHSPSCSNSTTLPRSADISRIISLSGQRLNQHILARSAASASSGPDTLQVRKTTNPRVGIFGEVVPAKIGSMPEKTLPRVGKVKLFSLSHQTPCQARYGLIEADACPVGTGDSGPPFRRS